MMVGKWPGDSILPQLETRLIENVDGTIKIEIKLETPAPEDLEDIE